MNSPVKVVLDQHGAVESVTPLHELELATPAPPPPVLDPKDPDSIRRQELLARLRDDRADMVRVANSVREIAETVEAAQTTLRFTRQSLRWLLLAGSTAALTMWITSGRGRRPRSALLAGVSMQLLRRWLKPSPTKGVKGALPAVSRRRLPAPAAARARAS